MIWKILEIEKTKDEDAIRSAYRTKLRSVNPEDDQEGFKALRRAYEEALEYAQTPEETQDEEHEAEEHVRKNDVDRWLDRVDAVYRDVRLRREENCWNELLHDSICDDLDTELEASEKLLVYLMGHSYLPQKIWQLLDKRFDYVGSIEQLKERFPENFLEYIKWQVSNTGFFDFELFDGKTDDHADEYMSKIYEIKNAGEERDLKKVRRLLDELESFQITHPYGMVEQAHYCMMKAGPIKELQTEDDESDLSEQERLSLRKQALDIMEELDFEYSDNSYIERIYAEALMVNYKVDKAAQIYDTLLEVTSDHYSALLGKAKCTFLKGDVEQAKEQIEDILEERVQDTDSLELLDILNRTLVKRYEERLEQKMQQELCFKLGWCYYQQKKFSEGIALLDRMGDMEDYDYINLRCRLYLAKEDYEKAYPWAKKWLSLIENSVDDGSKEMEKRKNRLSLAHFSIGVCIWEVQCRQQKKDVLPEAVSYIEKAVEEEKNVLVRLSYMEQLARIYLEEKRYEDCIEVCDTIIERDRGFFPAYVHRQKANHELRNAKEVIDDYFNCIEIYPPYAPPYVLAAEVFYAFDQYDDVEHVLEAAKEAEIDSDSLELYRIRCLHYKELSKERLEEALERIEKLKETIAKRTQDEPGDIEHLADVEKEHAILFWDMDMVEEALDVLDRYLKQDPECFSVLNLKSDILLREKRVKEALEICLRMYENNPTAYTQTKLGSCYDRMEQYEEALRHYEEAYQRDPKFEAVVRRLMYTYSYLSNRNSDLELCKKAIRYATEYIELSGNADGYVERGNLYIDLYELEKAVSDCKKAIELDSEAYYAYNNLGCALLKLRRVPEAVEVLQKVIAQEPDKDYLPYLNLAECYVLIGQYDDAIGAYQEVLRLRPKAEYIWKDLMAVYEKQGDFPKVIAYYEGKIRNVQDEINAAKPKKSDDIEYYENRLMRLYCDIAETYCKAGSYNKAEEYYEKVSARCSSLLKTRISVRPVKYAAEFWRNCGKFEKAEKVLVKAIKKMIPADRNSRVQEELYYTLATVYFEMGKLEKSRQAAQKYFKRLEERLGSLEQALTDRRYRPMYLYDIAIMQVCSGRYSEAKTYIEQIRKCHQCVTCEYEDCYEYYFGLGLIARMENRIEEAVSCFEKALEIEPFSECTRSQLRRLKK